MSYPTLAGAIANTIIGDVAEDLGLDRFPFLWWASGAGFKYPGEARHLFCKTQSAAEAFFLRPFTERILVEFEPDRVVHYDTAVLPQHRVGKYRLDFAVHDGATKLDVEVDGGQFHHRSSEQVEADYLRARRIIACGYVVVRFTATEVFRDASACWKQVDAILDSRRSR